MNQNNPWQTILDIAGRYKAWAFLDLETTGLQHPIDVVQIGLERGAFEGGAWHSAVALSAVIEPTVKVEAEAAAVHGLGTPEVGQPTTGAMHGLDDLHEIPGYLIALPSVVSWETAVASARRTLVGRQNRPDVVACWGSYDAEVLAALGERGPTLTFDCPVIDLQALYAATLPPSPDGRRRRGSLERAAVRFYCQPPGRRQSHRALADAMLARRVWAEMVRDARHVVDAMAGR
jgi:hypothetical protein